MLEIYTIHVREPYPIGASQRETSSEKNNHRAGGQQCLYTGANSKYDNLTPRAIACAEKIDMCSVDDSHYSSSRPAHPTMSCLTTSGNRAVQHSNAVLHSNNTGGLVGLLLSICAAAASLASARLCERCARCKSDLITRYMFRIAQTSSVSFSSVTLLHSSSGDNHVRLLSGLFLPLFSCRFSLQKYGPPVVLLLPPPPHC